MESYHEKLKRLIKEYVYLVYEITKDFPREELYGLTSQLKRAAMSVMLNYIEGFARRRNAVLKNSLEIAYASLKESDFCVEFAWDHHYISEQEDYNKARKLVDEIGAMLWKSIEGI